MTKKNIFLSLLVLVLFTGAGIGFWKVSKERLESEKKFLLKHENIALPPMPEWVPENFAEIVLTISGLENSTLLSDNELPKKLSEAFAADPWVESVESVLLRFPSGADIKLTYRKPAALVEIAPQQFLPVDKNGILLPGNSFQNIEQAKLRSYPQIIGITSKPPEKTGLIWNDSLVISASQLAAVLADIPAININKIRPERAAGVSASPPNFKLLTFNTEIIWGTFTPPDKTGKPHNSTEQRVKRIRALIEQFGSLDAIPDSLRPVKLD